MSPEDRALLKDLLTRQRVLSLGVIVENQPYTGLLPFVIPNDFQSAIVHASRLARHTAGLLPAASFSALIHEPDHPNADPLQLPRFIFQGEVQPLSKDETSYQEARALYIAKFPESAPIFELADFNLYRLQIKDGRFVAGFGRAFNLTARTLRDWAVE